MSSRAATGKSFSFQRILPGKEGNQVKSSIVIIQFDGGDGERFTSLRIWGYTKKDDESSEATSVELVVVGGGGGGSGSGF